MRVKHLIIPVLLLFAAADFSHAQTDYQYTPAAKDPSKKMTVIGQHAGSHGQDGGNAP